MLTVLCARAAAASVLPLAGAVLPQLPLPAPGAFALVLAGSALSVTVCSRPLPSAPPYQIWPWTRHDTHSGMNPNSILPSASLVPWQM